MICGLLSVDGGVVFVHRSKGPGPTVVFVHGNSLSSDGFLPFFSGPLARCHGMAAVDLPGHGRSPAASDPSTTYRPSSYAAIVAAVCRRVTDAEDDGVVLVGHSLGGHVCMAASTMIPRLRGIFVFGTPLLSSPPPLDRAFVPSPALAHAFTAELTTAQTIELAAAFVGPSGPPPAEMARVVATTDGRARCGLAAAVAAGDVVDEIAMAARLSCPIAVAVGEADRLVSRPYLESLDGRAFWRGGLHVVDGAGHSPHIERPQEFGRLLAEFLGDVCERD